MFARRALATAVVALAGCAALPTSASAEISADALTLRLPDLGPNYVTGVYRDCVESADGDGGPAVAERLAKRFELDWCQRDFWRDWIAPGAGLGARSVMSGAIVFRDAADATAAMNSERELGAAIGRTASRSLKARPVAPLLGDAGGAYDFVGIPCCMIPARPGSVRVWRSGRVVGLVASWGWAQGLAAETDRIAAGQQRRIVLPTPVAPNDFDDRYVALNDPGLGTPVPWLGERFTPRRGLPTLRFGDSSGLTGAGSPSYSVRIRYFHRTGIESIDLWRPHAWARFKRSRLGREIFGALCTSRVVRTRRSRIRLLADNHQRPCTGAPPAHRFAVVRVGRFVAVINGPLCYGCWDRRRRAQPYESWPGLLAIARGLRPRPAPPSAN